MVYTTSEEYIYKKQKLKELRSLISVGIFQFKVMGTKDKDVSIWIGPLQEQAAKLENELINMEDLVNERS